MGLPKPEPLPMHIDNNILGNLSFSNSLVFSELGIQLHMSGDYNLWYTSEVPTEHNHRT